MSLRRLALGAVVAGLAFTGTASADYAVEPLCSRPVAKPYCQALVGSIANTNCKVDVGYCAPGANCKVNVGYCAPGGNCAVNVGYCDDSTRLPVGT